MTMWSSDRIIALLFLAALVAIVLVGLIQHDPCWRVDEPLANYKCRLDDMRREWCVQWTATGEDRRICIDSAMEASDAMLPM